MRSLDELVYIEDPGIRFVEEWIENATNPVLRLPCDQQAGARALLALQVTTRSTLGALVYETGGLLVDHGWIRVLGAGSPRLPRALDLWNRLDRGLASHRLPGALLIADDVLGGFFALNGGAFGPQERPTVWYLPPDTLEWEDAELGYSEWLRWTLEGDLGQFYKTMRWPGWEDEVLDLPGDQGLCLSPFLWVAEGGAVDERRRSPVPIGEQWGLHASEFPKQLGLPYIQSDL